MTASPGAPSRAAPSPSASRCLAVASIAAMAAFVLGMVPIGPNPPREPGRFLDWWAQQGTATATMALARAAVMLLAVCTALVFTAGAVVALSRSARLARIWKWATPRALHGLLAVGSVAITASGPSTAGAAESPAPPEITLVDLGPIEAPGEPIPALPSLTDLGPVARAAIDDDRWVVAPGDHLWRVAEETLRDHGHKASDNEIARYWRRLIAANSAVVGDDPDLIHAGQVIVLPTVGPAQSW